MGEEGDAIVPTVVSDVVRWTVVLGVRADDVDDNGGESDGAQVFSVDVGTLLETM